MFRLHSAFILPQLSATFMASKSMEISRSDTLALEALSLYGTDEVEGAPGSPAPSDDKGSENSDTSTLRYDQEPYHLFKTRVEKLCQVLWPPKESIWQSWASSKMARLIGANKLLGLFIPSQQVPLIERLRGGDYNRIIGITLPLPKAGERNLILRVPRWDRGQTERLVATLEYLRQNSSIPTANVVAKDFGEQNPLGSPYIVQDRLPGSDLEILWNDLNHSQRCTVASELGAVVRKLLALESPVAGYIKTVEEGNRSTVPPIVVPFDLRSVDGDVFDEPEQRNEKATTASPRGGQSTLDFFRCQIGRWRAVDLDGNAPLIGRTIRLWDGMLNVVEEMDNLGFFTSLITHCLCHVDLYPRNIMANIQPDNSVRITGILDWDEALVAPKFVACEPPAWLWGFDDHDDSHHHHHQNQLPDDNDNLPAWPYEKPGANDVPDTREKREIKHVFERAAGADFVRFAYGEEFRLCRGLFRVALFGLTSNENYEAAERIVGDWAGLRLRRDVGM